MIEKNSLEKNLSLGLCMFGSKKFQTDWNVKIVLTWKVPENMVSSFRRSWWNQQFYAVLVGAWIGMVFLKGRKYTLVI